MTNVSQVLKKGVDHLHEKKKKEGEKGRTVDSNPKYIEISHRECVDVCY